MRIEWFQTYPYLAWSLLMLGLFALVVAACPAGGRKSLILAAALTLPFAPLGAYLGRTYWDPARWGGASAPAPSAGSPAPSPPCRAGIA